ncbi:MAG TPA: hypothetical protein VNB94_10005 [Mycobacteriales bacterium]|nr:hypothetical protein [Mycobacteriales bacterium]
MTVDRAGLAWEVMAGFDDPATTTFDAVLAAAGLDEMTARALRFWQRESVHNTKQYAASALPAVLDVMARAQAEAQAATDRGSDAWRSHGPAEIDFADAAPLPADTPVGQPPAAPAPSPDAATDDLLEIRRSAVAARLAHLG